MEEKRGKTGGKWGKTGKNGGEMGGKRGENGGKWGRMGTVMNGSSCSGLLHCHYFLYTYPCLCCSHLHNFHPHEGILYVRIHHLVSQKWASSSDISKALARLGTSSKSSVAIEPLHRPPLPPWTSEKEQKEEKKPKTTKTGKKKQQQRGRARTREGTRQPRGPPKKISPGQTGDRSTFNKTTRSYRRGRTFVGMYGSING